MDLWSGWLLAGIGPVIAIGSIALAVTLYMRSRNPTIRGPALTGTAQVLSIQTTGTMINQSYVLKIALRVQIPGRQPYDVTVSRQIHPIQMPAIQPGTVIPVQVDAANPQNVQFDFNRPVTPWQAGPPGAPPTVAQIADAYQQAPGAGPVMSAAALLASGQRVPGVLKSYAATGTTPRSLGRSPSRPEFLDAQHYILEVELQFPNLAPVTARAAQPVPPAQVPNLAIGQKLNCVVDPADPARRFVVDWDNIAR
jgi:hypothetical protein